MLSAASLSPSTPAPRIQTNSLSRTTTEIYLYTCRTSLDDSQPFNAIVKYARDVTSWVRNKEENYARTFQYVTGRAISTGDLLRSIDPCGSAEQSMVDALMRVGGVDLPERGRCIRSIVAIIALIAVNAEECNESARPVAESHLGELKKVLINDVQAAEKACKHPENMLLPVGVVLWALCVASSLARGLEEEEWFAMRIGKVCDTLNIATIGDIEEFLVRFETGKRALDYGKKRIALRVWWRVQDARRRGVGGFGPLPTLTMTL